MTLKWKGDELIKKKNKAVAFGINKTMSDAVKHSLDHHPEWVYRTGVAERSIQIKEFATPKKHEGFWGSVWTEIGKSNYVWYLEFYHGHFLRKAADIIYPKLKKNILSMFK